MISLPRLTLVLPLLLFLTDPGFAQQILWQRQGQGEYAHYGYRVLALGDQNNDGFADWAVMSYGSGGYGDPNETTLELFHGGNPLPLEPYHTFRGAPDSAWRIIDGAVPGDLNGDGYRDWALTRQYANDTGHRQFRLYWGGPMADTTADVVMQRETGNFFRGLGDFNSDGTDDLCHYHYYRQNFPAWLEVYWGGATFDTLSDWRVFQTPGDPFQVDPSGVGDLNGDGATDFISPGLDAPHHIYLGGAAPDTAPAYSWPTGMGDLIGMAADLSGDGRDEVVFGAANAARLVLGRAIPQPVVDVTLNFPCGNYFPMWAWSAGDLNRDGYEDLVCVSDYCADSYFGTLAMYLGGPYIHPAPTWLIRGWYNEFLGVNRAAGVGDVNGDGVEDLLVGAWTNDVPEGSRGRALILSGDTTLIAGTEDPFIPLPSSLTLSAVPNPFNATTQLHYTLPQTEHVSLIIHDLLGRKIADIVQQTQETGEYAVHWDAKSLPSGVYFARLTTQSANQTQKLLLLR